MKTSFSLLFLILFNFFLGSESNAQKLLVNTYAGYAFDDAISYSGTAPEYNGLLEGGLIWGAGLEYIPYRSGFGIELLYMRQDTKAIPDFSSGDTALDVGINYIFLAPTKYFDLNRSHNFYTYTGAMLGVAIVNSSSKTTSGSVSNTSFAWGLNLGMKYLPSENVALNLVTRLHSTSQKTKDELYSGSQIGTEGSSSILQFGVYGGISYIFSLD